MKTSRTTLPLSKEEREAIKTIRENFGVKSDADAIRIALRELERAIKASTQPITPASRNGALIPRMNDGGFPAPVVVKWINGQGWYAIVPSLSVYLLSEQ